MMSLGLLRWDQMDAPGDLWLALHDEGIIEVPIDQAKEAAEALQQAFTINIAGIPFPAEAQILGRHWESPTT